MSWRKHDNHPVWRGGRGVIPFVLHLQQRKNVDSLVQQANFMRKQMEHLQQKGYTLDKTLEAIKAGGLDPEAIDKVTKH